MKKEREGKKEGEPNPKHPSYGSDSLPDDASKQKPDKNPPYERDWSRRYGLTIAIGSMVGSVLLGPVGVAFAAWTNSRAKKDIKAEEKHYTPDKPKPDDDYKKAWFRQKPHKVAALVLFSTFLAPIAGGVMAYYFLKRKSEDKKKELEFKLKGRRERLAKENQKTGGVEKPLNQKVQAQTNKVRANLDPQTVQHNGPPPIQRGLRGQSINR